MKTSIAFLALIFLFVSSIAHAQDIHWSQFDANPIYQNPGNTGQFNGDIRFIGNYRDQWRSVTVPFNTINATVDTKLPFNKNLGVGGMIFHDVVGDGQFRTVELQANTSYLLKLTSDSVHTIRPGVNFGLNHRQLNTDQFYFDSQFDGIQYNPSLPTNETFATDRRSNFSFGIGAVYQYYQNERFNITGGVALFNINRPDQGFFANEIQRDRRLNLFANGIYKLNYDWDILPSMQFSVQGVYREFMIGARAKYTLVNRLGEYRALYGGLHYRNKDAAYLSVGMDYQNWFVGMSYDINFSKLVPASRLRGGFELAVRYILTRFKPKKIVHRICPDYI
ncbi:MAG: PorP/SprF family type IX secretion system membrane protein [Crocinitomicaceae bacterium]